MSDAVSTSGADRQLIERNGEKTAKVSLWWKQVPTLPNERVGVIGEFFAGDPVAATKVLTAAEDVLREQGCTIAVGPMDGNTWQNYRFVTESTGEPPFFLEPQQPKAWPEWWKASGYSVLADYFSTVTDDLAYQDARLGAVSTRMSAAGVTIREIDLTRFEQELGGIHDVSLAAFGDNFLYTPISTDAFIAQYRKLQTKVLAPLLRLAEQGGRVVGYVFAMPDFAQAQRGQSVDTIIVKTLAVRPGRAYAGLGALLLGEVHAAALKLGYKRAIHALMHESNQSRALSAHYAKTLRRYALLAKPLRP